MKIHGVELRNFMLFDELKTEFSPNINIFIGENSTGKTAVLKALYVGARAYTDAQTEQEKNPGAFYYEMERIWKENPVTFMNKPAYWRDFFEPLLDGVFRPENDNIFKIANRFQKKAAFLSVDFGQNEDMWFWFNSRRGSKSVVPRLPPRDSGNIIYIPTGEMISHTESFASLYEEYHIPFDETCYTLVRLLDRPQKRELPKALQAVVNTLEKAIGGKVVQKGRVFYLLTDNDEQVEMTLVSDGYRKLSTLLALLGSGALADGSILFWDEPETNMNPRMIKTLVDALIAVAGAGVQVFVATHDYFVQQYFGLAAAYKEKYGEVAGKLDFRFFSLYRETVEKEEKPDSAEPERENTEMNDTDTEPDGETAEPDNRPASRIAIESAARLVDLKHNAVTEENDVLGDREMGLIYGDDAE